MLEELQFDLPEDLIATEPAPTREEAKLFVYDRKKESIEHAQVKDIGRWLEPPDLLVFNQTKVRPARVEWKKTTGGDGELLLLRCTENHKNGSIWEALVSGRRLKPNEWYELPEKNKMKILGRIEGSRSRIELSKPQKEIELWLERVGLPPLPPYIRAARRRKGIEENQISDRERYQTIFANKPGAVAAPTAGLHFSERLLGQLRAVGVGMEWINLDVGWGTFQPITDEQMKLGRLHEEWVEVSGEASARFHKQLKGKNRIVAVGTTTVRALEWWDRQGRPLDESSGWCNLFLRHPWQSELVHGLVTNFHLPGSSLLALVAGFLGENGTEKIKELYQEAILRQYRFYSYGDAMLII